jgi:hypothetical protein
MPLPTEQPKPNRGLTILGRLKAGFLVLTVIIAMVACVGLQPILKGVLQDQDIEVTGIAATFLEKPWIGVLLGLPALAACVPLLMGSRRTLLWMTLGTILALLPVIYLFLGFLGVMAPLYEYRPL